MNITQRYEHFKGASFCRNDSEIMKEHNIHGNPDKNAENATFGSEGVKLKTMKEYVGSCDPP